MEIGTCRPRNKIIITTTKKAFAQLSEGNTNFYLYDFDITQDYINIPNFTELRNTLLERPDFVEEGGTYNPDIRYIIVNNKKAVGTNVLTYIDTKHNLRCKYYNKFCCQLTCPSIMRSFGSHVFDFLFCPDKRLNSTFKNKDAIQCGLTRLECTINGGRIPKEKELNNIIGNMYDIVNIPIFYEVPFKCQFKALTEKNRQKSYIL